jgi:hypothetical protein
MAFLTLSYAWAIILLGKLTSCSSHSAFFDSKHCWFLLASVSLFKIRYKHEIKSEISLNELAELSSSPKELKIIMIILTKLRTKNFENIKQNNCFLINICLSFIKLMYIWYRDFLLTTKISVCNYDIILNFFIVNIPCIMDQFIKKQPTDVTSQYFISC